MNIIEQVFYQLKKRVFQSNSGEKFRNIRLLRTAIKREWRAMGRDLEYIRGLVDSYQRRLQAVVANNGYNSKY